MTEKNADVVREADRPLYEMIYCTRCLIDGVESLDDIIDRLQEDIDELREMKAAGVVLDDQESVQGGHATLLTTDPAVAEHFGFENTEDFFGDDEEDEEDESCDQSMWNLSQIWRWLRPRPTGRAVQT